MVMGRASRILKGLAEGAGEGLSGDQNSESQLGCDLSFQGVKRLKPQPFFFDSIYFLGVSPVALSNPAGLSSWIPEAS